MTQTFKYILVGGASALIGAVSGYIFCKKQLQNKFEEELTKTIDEELKCIRKSREDSKTESVRSSKKERSIDYLRDTKDIVNGMFPNMTFNDYQWLLLKETLYQSYKEGEEISYNELKNRFEYTIASFESPPEDIPEEDLGESYEDSDCVDEVQAVMDGYSNQPPRVISEDEYSSLPPYFEFLTYKYFEDDVLLDDGEEIVDDIEGLVGDALIHFGADDNVFVLNGNYGFAIEIIRMHTSYAAWNGIIRR